MSVRYEKRVRRDGWLSWFGEVVIHDDRPSQFPHVTMCIYRDDGFGSFTARALHRKLDRAIRRASRT